MEKISVIIPVYNVSQYLEKCLDSVLKQTYDNIEILLINDASTDNSGEICKNYSLKNNNIRYFDLEKNMGLSYARNIGIDNATGSLIGFVDSYDWIEETMYEILYLIKKRYNVPIAMCNYNIIYPDSIVKYDHVNEDTFFSNTIDALTFYLHKNGSQVWNRLYDKNLFENIRFPVGKIFEDCYIMYLLIDKSGSMAISSQFLYNYIKRSDSITSMKFGIHGFDYIHAIIQRQQYLNEKYSASDIINYGQCHLFIALINLANNIILLEEDQFFYNEFNLIHNIIYSKYSYNNCGFSPSEIKILEVLKKGIKYYKFFKKILIK